MPKQRVVDVVVPGTPAQVAERLRSRTRWRLIPGQGQFLGSFDKPLGGRVGPSSFRVARNVRDWLTLTQAVAVGQLSEVEGGTRVRAVVGLPVGLTWMLRATTLLSVVAIAGAVLAVVAGGQGLTELALALGILGLATGGATAGIGLNVHNADTQVDPLVDEVLAACGGTAIPAEDATAQARPRPVGVPEGPR